jgi:cytochrome b561
MLNNTQKTFGTVSKSFHWIIALMIIAMLIIGCAMGFTHKETFQSFMFYHQSIGVTVLILMVSRLVWRLCSTTPQYPTSMNTMEKRIAHAMAWLLYLLIFLIIGAGMMMTAYHGYAIKFWAWPFHLPVAANKAMSHFFNTVHLVLAWTILTCVVMHIGASCYHHFVRKDDILKRMM